MKTAAAVILILLAALLALPDGTTHCAPESEHGPTIGGVIKIAGC